jgi:ABC-type Mn2+/Zn2+ transport system permease subunit
VQTLEFLSDPQLRAIYLPAILGGVAVVLMCGLLSVFVVLKRISFVGQGVSHSAFGGLGVAAVVSVLVPGVAGAATDFVIVVVFCIAAALGMGMLSDRRSTQADTAIGVVLVGAMALGALLVDFARSAALAGMAGGGGAGGGAGHVRVQSWESILFGSIFAIGPADAALAWGLALAVALTLLLVRRPLLFWALDESAAPAFGVPGRAMRLLLMVLLAVAVVTAMKLAGVVLATALLVLPGALALRLSDRLLTVLALALVAAVASLLAGLVLSFEFNWQPGPSIVLVATALFGAAWLPGALRAQIGSRTA